jgi:hypothetical protein
METDPLNSLTNSLSKLSEDEGAAIQLLISPAGHEWQEKPRKLALEIQQGKNPHDVTAGMGEKFLRGSGKFAGEVFDQAFGTKKDPQI